MAPEEDDILGAEYDRREFRETCEPSGSTSPPGTPEEPAAAPAPAPAALRRPTTRPRSWKEARAYWAARDRAYGERRRHGACPRAAGAIAPVERTELGLAKDQRVAVLRAELAATGWASPRRTTGPPATCPGATSSRSPCSPRRRPSPAPRAARRPSPTSRPRARAPPRGVSRLATTDDVIGRAWPKPELGPDGLPLPLAARGGAATAPAGADGRRGAGAAGVARPGGARTRRRGGARSRRSAGGLPHRRRPTAAPDAVHRQDQAPAAAAARPVRAAPLRRHDAHARATSSSRAATSVSHQGGSDAEAAFARAARRGRGNVLRPLHRRGARARPMRGAPGPPAGQLALQPPRRGVAPAPRRGGPRRSRGPRVDRVGGRPPVASALTVTIFPWPRTRRYRTRGRSGA